MSLPSSKYPNSKATESDLWEQKDFVTDTLDQDITAASPDDGESLAVADGSKWPANGGVLRVTTTNELISYTSVSGNTLTGIDRGHAGTTPQAADKGDTIWLVAASDYHNKLAAEVIAIEEELGTGLKGTKADLAARLNAEHRSDGSHKAISIEGAYTLPSTDGTNGQVLMTDGNGNVSWQTKAGANQLSELTDVGTVDYTAGKVLVADGSQFNAAVLQHNQTDNPTHGVHGLASGVHVLGCKIASGRRVEYNTSTQQWEHTGGQTVTKTMSVNWPYAFSTIHAFATAYGVDKSASIKTIKDISMSATSASQQCSVGDDVTETVTLTCYFIAIGA